MRTRGITPSKLIIHAIFIIYGIICVVPLLVVLSISLSNENSINMSGYSILPKGFTLLAYKYIFSGGSPIPKAYLITILVTVVGTILHVFISSMLAYGISRKEIKYRNIVTFLLVFCLLFNGGIVPWYILITKYLHLNNTIFVMFVPYMVSSVNVIMMRNFFSAIPDSLVESARIDGSGEFNTFIKIIVPLSKPILATIALFVSVFLWNDWYTCSLFIDDSRLYGLQFLLQSIMNNIAYLQGNSMVSQILANLPSESARMATCVLAVGPIVLAYSFFQRYFVSGLTLGAVKE